MLFEPVDWLASPPRPLSTSLHPPPPCPCSRVFQCLFFIILQRLKCNQQLTKSIWTRRPELVRPRPKNSISTTSFQMELQFTTPTFIVSCNLFLNIYDSSVFFWKKIFPTTVCNSLCLTQSEESAPPPPQLLQLQILTNSLQPQHTFKHSPSFFSSLGSIDCLLVKMKNKHFLFLVSSSDWNFY